MANPRRCRCCERSPAADPIRIELAGQDSITVDGKSVRSNATPSRT